MCKLAIFRARAVLRAQRVPPLGTVCSGHTREDRIGKDMGDRDGKKEN